MVKTEKGHGNGIKDTKCEGQYQWCCKSIRVSLSIQFSFLKLFYFFDFLVTGGTYDNKTWTKIFKKKKKL